MGPDAATNVAGARPDAPALPPGAGTPDGAERRN